MAPFALEAAVQFLGVLIGILVYFPRVQATGNFLEMTSFHNDGEMNLFDASVYSSNRTQYGRIFQFNKQDTAIRVELAFAIPFLSIPVKTKPGSEKKNYLVDVNLGALAAGGIFTVASLLFIPKLFNGLAPQVTYSRSESEAGGLAGILSRLDETLMEHNIDTATCTQRAVCWLVNSAVDKVNTGTGSSMDKIVDGIVSNRWMQKMVKGTAIQEAIDNGKKGKNCSVLYSRCPLTQEAVASCQDRPAAQ